MKIEITVRLEDSQADIHAMIEGLTTTFDPQLVVKGRLRGGFYFETTCSPAEFFVWAQNEGFKMSDFDNVEIKPV